MAPDNNMLFLQKKLEHIKTAVMYTLNNSVVKLPNDVVTFLTMDDHGQLWFAAHQPKHWLKTEEQRFPVRLLFYQKGVSYYIETSGVATITSREYDGIEKYNLPAGTLILKMTPTSIEYTEPRQKQSFPQLSKWYSTFSNWMLQHFSLPYPQRQFWNMGKTK